MYMQFILHLYPFFLVESWNPAELRSLLIFRYSLGDYLKQGDATPVQCSACGAKDLCPILWFKTENDITTLFVVLVSIDFDFWHTRNLDFLTENVQYITSQKKGKSWKPHWILSISNPSCMLYWNFHFPGTWMLDGIHLLPGATARWQKNSNLNFTTREPFSEMFLNLFDT